MLFPLTWPEPKLAPGEAVLSRLLANQMRHGIARGGTIAFTDRRMVFEPNNFEAALRVQPQSWDRSIIQNLEMAPRGLNPTSWIGRLLRVNMLDGSTEHFVVVNPQTLIDQMKTWLR